MIRGSNRVLRCALITSILLLTSLFVRQTSIAVTSPEIVYREIIDGLRNLRVFAASMEYTQITYRGKVKRYRVRYSYIKLGKDRAETDVDIDKIGRQNRQKTSRRSLKMWFIARFIANSSPEDIIRRIVSSEVHSSIRKDPENIYLRFEKDGLIGYAVFKKHGMSGGKNPLYLPRKVRWETEKGWNILTFFDLVAQ